MVKCIEVDKVIETTKYPKQILLLEDEDCKYYLQRPSWDCNWYWGFGYLSGYEKGKPLTDKYQASHTHISSYIYKEFNEMVIEKYKKDKWNLLELFKSFYILKEYAEFVNRGGSHITENPLKEILKNEEAYKDINLYKIPKIFEEIYKILDK